MKRILIAAFIIVAWASASFAQTASVSTADALTRVGQGATPPVTTSISLTLGRGEIGSAQAIVTASGGSVTVTGLSCSTFTGPATLAASICTFYRELYVSVTGTAGVSGTNVPLGTGTYPEPLIPFNDPETGASLGTGNAINAASQSVASGQNQPYWIDFSIPRGSGTVPPGTYTGTVTVTTSAGNKTVPVSLLIYNLELPIVPTELSEFELFSTTSQPGLTGDIEAESLMRNKIMANYVAPGNAATFQTQFGLNRTSVQGQTFYGALCGGGFSGTNPSSGTIAGYVALFPGTLPIDGYIADEIQSSCSGGALTSLESASNNLHGGGAKSSMTSNTAWVNGSGNYIDYNILLDSQAGWPSLPYAGFGQLWSYASCNFGNGNYPEPMIDYPPINSRQQSGFLNYFEGAKGVLYYSSTRWTAGNASGSWTNLNASSCGTGSGPGDGMMIYPPGPIGSSEPAPGIRLKAYRDGVQDYEISHMLAALGGTSYLNSQLSTVASNWTSFSTNASTLLTAHNNIEAQISSINTPAGPAPVVEFLDLISGPTGTILSIGGNNFGATQNTSIVTINGTPASAYYTWSNSKIQFQVAGGTTSGAVVVTVGATSSTCINHDDGCSFTIRSGNIYYVSPGGSDANNGTSLATPWLTATHAVNTMTAGSIVYYTNGFTVTAPDGTGWHAALLISTGHGAPTCASGTPCAMVAYPGATATFGSLTPVSGSGDTTIYGIRTDGTTSNWILSGLTIRGPNCAFSITGGTNWRTINNDVRATDTGAQQCGAGDYENLTGVYNYGNNFHQSGASNKQGHTVYFTTNVNSVFMGWNQVVSNTTCYDVQFHSSSANDQFDLHVHDNYFTGNPCAAINFATVDPSKGVVEAYNNVMWKSGNGPVPTGGGADFACIYMAGILNAGPAPSGSVQIYNNTMRDCGSQNTGRWGAVLIADQGSGSGIHYNFTNNITSLAANELYFGFDGTASSSYVTCSGGNLFFNQGATPSYCNTTAVNADPLFVSTVTPNLNLQAGSPAIAAGSSAHVPTYDDNGALRPSPPAIGAYELSGASPIVTGVPLAPLLTKLIVQ